MKLRPKRIPKRWKTTAKRRENTFKTHPKRIPKRAVQDDCPKTCFENENAKTKTKTPKRKRKTPKRTF